MTTPSAFDYSAALTQADSEILAIIGEDFLGLVPVDLEEMRRAAKSNDRDSLRRMAHTYKGLAGNFAARPLVDAANELQSACHNGSFEQRHLDAVECELGALCDALRSYFQRKPGQD